MQPEADSRPADLDRPVALHTLVFQPDGEDVVIGRPDIDEYVVLPADGAELIRLLADGLTPRQAADRYQETYGESVDILDLLGTLDELGFVSAAGESVAGPTGPVRWQRLGRALFSPVAWVCYAALVAAWIVELARVPQLDPGYHQIFFTKYFTVIELALYVGQFPLLLIHEGFHALAGRRLGLRSRLSLGHRLMYVVLETSMDGLVAVPRRRRYLPILAGMLSDVLVMALLTLAADALRLPGGGFPLVGRLCLALAYGTLLRLAWQLSFYLRTDLYLLMTTALGCVDLHGAAKAVLRNAVRRWTGRPLEDESHWHPTDRRVARCYAWLMVAGYALSIGIFVGVVVPVTVRFAVGVAQRLSGGGPVASVVDAGLLLLLSVAQVLTVVLLAYRDRRRKRRGAALPG